MKVFGLDLGSSTIKGAVLDLATRQVGAIVKEPFPEPLAGLPARHLEIPLRDVITGVERVVTRLLEIEPSVTALFTCGQMGGIALMHPSTGETLTNYLSWRDQRTLTEFSPGKTYLDEILSRWTPQQFAGLGSELKPGSATALLFWLAHRGRLPSIAIPAGLGDTVLAQLCQCNPRMEPTQAIGLMDLDRGDWHRGAFVALGISKLRWPGITMTNHPVGTWTLKGHALTCYPVLGDQQCALRGAGLEVGDLSLNISTGGQTSRLTETLELGPYQSRYFFDGTYLNTITHLPAGRSLNVLMGLLTELATAENVSLRDPWGTVNRALNTADGGGLECDLAFFSGPMGNVGHIRGITVDNLTVGNLFHAAFHNLANNFSQCSDRVFPQRDWQRIVLSGGLTQSVPLLRQMIQERLPGVVKESTEAEETLLGLLEVARGVFHV
jgi:sugar (pentulose or hexulose) kinase